MTERPNLPGFRHSVFARLMATMVAMALTILVLVVGFFLATVAPMLSQSANDATERYVELLAAVSPGRDAVQRAADEAGLEVRYEGPTGSWSTSPELPSIAQVRAGRSAPLSDLGRFGPRYRLLSAPGGGSYLFTWGYTHRLQAAHDWLLVLLSCSLLAAVFIAHSSLRRMLAPLRGLLDAVTALGDGNLNVAVPSQTRDEFGALTNAFNDMVGRVREMVRSRDQLLLDVSHELRSPLTRMKVALALAEDHPQSERLLGNVAKMEAMVTELLELERLREGGGLALGLHDLMRIIHDAVSSFEGRTPGVVISAAPEEVELRMDPEQVRRALDNVLENAVKYSLADSRPVDLSLAVGTDSVSVRVSDDGPGIPDEDLAQLFEPFFRVDRSRSRSTGGYGLGLSLAKRIMESHGGEIVARNNAGRGASFVLTFPVSLD